MAAPLTAELVDPIPALVGESPIWDARRDRLIWVDVPAGLVHRADGSGRRLSSVPIGAQVGSALPGEQGDVLLATSEGLSVLEADDTVTTLSRALADEPDLRFNDGKTDPRGHAIAGTLSYSRRENAASLYRLDDGPNLTPIVAPVSASNGLGWTGDGRTMYYIDTPTRRVDVFDYDADAGTVSGRRVLATIPPAEGKPDGLCTDHDGGIWVALWGGGSVVRFTPSGAVDRRVRLPVPFVTSCAFGGAGGDILFVTMAMDPNGPAQEDPAAPEAGCLFAVDTGFTGPPATPWRRVAAGS